MQSQHITVDAEASIAAATVNASVRVRRCLIYTHDAQDETVGRQYCGVIGVPSRSEQVCLTAQTCSTHLALAGTCSSSSSYYYYYYYYYRCSLTYQPLPPSWTLHRREPPWLTVTPRSRRPTCCCSLQPVHAFAQEQPVPQCRSGHWHLPVQACRCPSAK